MAISWIAGSGEFPLGLSTQLSEPTAPALRSKGPPEPRLMSEARLIFPGSSFLPWGFRGEKEQLSSLCRTVPHTKQVLSARARGRRAGAQSPDARLFPLERSSDRPLQSYIKPKTLPVLVFPSCPLHLLVSLACPPLTMPTAPTFPTLASITSCVHLSVHPSSTLLQL